MKLCATGIVLAALCAGSSAHAQTTQAVEWKVSDGGNGHWYMFVSTARTWRDADLHTRSIGGHLVTISSSAEGNYLRTLGSGTAWLGLFQNPSSPFFSEPAGGWEWVTGEPLAYANWRINTNGQPIEPNNIDGTSTDVAVMDAPDRTSWNDVSPVSSYAYWVEFDADCNADGIVDYGQILRGDLEDLNANGVPDICETSISSVLPPSVPAQGGSTVTIRGNGFPANPTVLIGGVPATNVVRESATRITATSPATLPGMASVSVNDFTLADGIYIRPECGSDLDQNGSVDAGDIAIILLDFGPCYEPPAALAAPVPTPLIDEPAQKPVASKRD